MNGLTKKKILMIVTPLRQASGIFRRLKLWTEYLSNYYEIEVMCYATHENVIKMLEKEGVKILHKKSLNHLGRVTILPGTFVIYQEIKSYSPDIIISMFLWSDFLTSCALFLQKVLRKKSIPHVVHIVGAPRVVSNRITRIRDRIVAILGFWTPEKIITICHHDAQMVSSEYFVEKNRIVVIPIGVEFFPLREKEQLHHPFTFGVVARLVPVKNIEGIIGVFHDVVAETNKRVRLEIFGEGKSRKKLESLAGDLGLTDQVVFNGWVNNPRFAFDSIDCLLSFSHSEGTPRSILESGESGVPTIAKNVGGVEEVIQDSKTGYLVHLEQELKEKMLYVLHTREEEVLKMGLAAKRFMQEHHSIENEIRRLKNLIEELTVGC